MKFSEILHEQPSNPWTNPGLVVRRLRNYYLGGKNHSAHLLAYLRIESTNNQTIGEIITTFARD